MSQITPRLCLKPSNDVPFHSESLHPLRQPPAPPPWSPTSSLPFTLPTLLQPLWPRARPHLHPECLAQGLCAFCALLLECSPGCPPSSLPQVSTEMSLPGLAVSSSSPLPLLSSALLFSITLITPEVTPIYLFKCLSVCSSLVEGMLH